MPTLPTPERTFSALPEFVDLPVAAPAANKVLLAPLGAAAGAGPKPNALAAPLEALPPNRPPPTGAAAVAAPAPPLPNNPAPPPKTGAAAGVAGHAK
eukprot:4556466-Pleurochrysis_carterae.AAC.1